MWSPFESPHPIKTIVRILLEHDISALPVVDEQYRVRGVVSEADLIEKEAEQAEGYPEPWELLTRRGRGAHSKPVVPQAAAQAAHRPGGPQLDPDAGGLGLREWLDALTDPHGASAAAFGTYLSGAAVMTGRAGLALSHRLRRLGHRLAQPPESFIVGKQNHLLPGEIQRAAQWGRRLAGTDPASPAGSGGRTRVARWR